MTFLLNSFKKKFLPKIFRERFEKKEKKFKKKPKGLLALTFGFNYKNLESSILLMKVEPVWFPSFFFNSNSILWFRFDLRLQDNLCFETSLKLYPLPIIIFCKESKMEKKFSQRKKIFLKESVDDIKKQLNFLKIPFLIFNDLPEKIIPSLVKKFKVDHLLYSINPFFENNWKSHQFLISEIRKNGADPKIFLGNSLIYPRKGIFRKDLICPSFSNFFQNFTKNEINDYFPELIPRKRDQKFFNYEVSEMTSDAQINLLDRKTFFLGGETYILSILKNHKFQILPKNFIGLFKPWIELGCISPRTLASSFVFQNSFNIRKLVFYFFFKIFYFFKQIHYQKVF